MAIIENEMDVASPESPRQASSSQDLKGLSLSDLLGMLSPKSAFFAGLGASILAVTTPGFFLLLWSAHSANGSILQC